MWLIVMFDLPTLEKAEARAYSRFRSYLLREGFSMMQYSVYTRSTTDSGVHYLSKRVEKRLPDKGHIRLLNLTDSQYANIKVVVDREELEPEKNQNVFVF